MRILSGRWAGRDLVSPPDRRVRPTAEGVRDVWLRLLQAELEGATVIDLFAGSGALGLEALSRGAVRADFVETRPSSLHALKANVAALHARDRVRVFKRDALALAGGLERSSYRIALADPPYQSRMLDRLIEIWMRGGFADVLSVEHAADHPLPEGGTRHLLGSTAITTYRIGP